MKLCVLLLATLLPCLSQTMTVDTAKAFGNPSAAARVDVFSDFSCPMCREFHTKILPRLEADYGPSGKIYIVMHEFPLNIPAHKYSREAAGYATAAARIGRYDVVADKLFETQEIWSPPTTPPGKIWEEVASALKPAEAAKVQAMAKDPSVLAEVQADYNLGERLSVNSTPTVFFTGHGRRYPVPNPMNYDLFKSLIDALK